MGNESEKKPVKTVKRPTDLTNLKKAQELKSSGYPTLVHASPYKDEIDEMIIEKRWPPRVIVNELIKKYPKDQHPSYKSIENYRDKYIDAETAVHISEGFRKMYEGIMGEFDVYVKSVETVKILQEGLVKSITEGPESKLGMPTDANTKRAREVMAGLESVFRMEQGLGLRDKAPDKWEGKLTDERTQTPEKLNERIGEVGNRVLDAVDKLRARIDKRSQEGVEQGQGGGNKSSGAGKSGEVHGGHTGVSEQQPPRGVVQDTGGQVGAGQDHGETTASHQSGRDSKVDSDTSAEKPRQVDVPSG